MDSMLTTAAESSMEVSVFTLLKSDAPSVVPFSAMLSGKAKDVNAV